MISIYAVKMVDLNDILQSAGRPLICDFILNNVQHYEENILTKMKNDEVLEIDTSPRGNFPVYNIVKAYTFKFIPVDLVEEKLMMGAMIKPLEDLRPHLMTINRIEKIDKIINKLRETYEKYRELCAGDNIINSSCFMLIYDDNKIVNVHVAVPRIIINSIVFGEQKYECSDCGKIEVAKNNSFNEFMPDMYYKIDGDKLNYYCKECRKEHYGLKHIGE